MSDRKDKILQPDYHQMHGAFLLFFAVIGNRRFIVGYCKHILCNGMNTVYTYKTGRTVFVQADVTAMYMSVKSRCV